MMRGDMRSSRLAAALLACLIHANAQTAAPRRYPQIVPQVDDDFQAAVLAVSPDGSWIAAGGALDGTVRIIDPHTGLMLRSLAISSEGAISANRQVTRVAISGDGKYLAARAGNDTVTVWETAAGSRVASLHSEGHFLAFTPGNLLVLSLEGSRPEYLTGERLVRYDLVRGQEVGEPLAFPPGSPQIERVLFTPDGATMITGHASGAVAFWDAATHRLKSQVKAAAVNDLALTRDGKLLAVAGADHKINLWDVGTSALVRTLEGHTAPVMGVAFDPTGRFLASCGGMLDGTVRIWDVATAKELHRITVGEYAAPASVIFDSAGKWVAAADKNPRLWDAANGREITPDRSKSATAEAQFTPSWTWIESHGSHEIRLWDARSGQLARRFSVGAENQILWAQVTPDEKNQLAAFIPGNTGPISVRRWEIDTGREQSTLHVTDPVLAGEAVTIPSPDGRFLAAAALGKDEVALWDMERGAKAGSLLPPKGYSPSSLSADIVLFSPRGKWLLAESGQGLIVWRVADRSVLLLLELDQKMGERLAVISPDERWLAYWDAARSALRLADLAAPSAPPRDLAVHAARPLIQRCEFNTKSDLLSCLTGESVETWRIPAGQVLPTVPAHFDVSHFRFSRDGELVFCEGTQDTLRVVNPVTGSERRIPQAGGDCLSSDFQFSPDSRHLAVMGRGLSTGIRLYDLAANQLLGQIALFRDDSEWMAATPDGLFDGSPGGWKQLFWRFSDGLRDVLPAEAFFSEFYDPGLVGELLRGAMPAARAAIADRDRRQPTVELQMTRLDRPGGAFARAEVAVEEDRKPMSGRAGSGVRDVRLFRDGSLVKVWHGAIPLDGAGKAKLNAEVALAGGENRFSAYAFNLDNVKSLDAEGVVNGPAGRRRTFHILSIGINSYASASFRSLKYAEADARSFADSIEAAQAGVARFERIEKNVLLSAAATKAAILGALRAVAQTAGPEDAVLVFFAGHGTAAGGRFYLIPADLAAAEALTTGAISDIELQQAFEPIDASHLGLIIDACNSGQALESEEARRGPMNSAGLAQLAYEKGMYVLTASQSFQSALEVTRLGHGLLTYALVEEGLKTSAPDSSPRDGRVDIREWMDFAVHRVPELDAESNQQRGLDIPAVDRRQIPRVFFRREPDRELFVMVNSVPPSRK